MTEEQIIKALEDLIKSFDGKAVDFMTISFALDHIKRQKAEIERLTHNIEAMAQTMPNCAKVERAEAVKEFAVRLKGLSFQTYKGYFAYEITAENLNNLVKEMACDST